MKKRNTIFAAILIALMCFVGYSGTQKQDVSGPNIERVSDLAVSQAISIERKEAYKLDNSEYKSAVATKSRFSGGEGGMYVLIGAVMLGITIFLMKLFRQLRTFNFNRALTYSIIAALFAFTIFFPAEGIATMAMAAPALTPKEEEKQKTLLEKIEKQVKGIMADATKENVTESALNKRIEKLNDDIKKLNDDSMKELKERVDKLAKSNEELQAELAFLQCLLLDGLQFLNLFFCGLVH